MGLKAETQWRTARGSKEGRKHTRALGGKTTEILPEVGTAEFVVWSTMRIPSKPSSDAAKMERLTLCAICTKISYLLMKDTYWNLLIVCLSAHKVSLTTEASYLGGLFSPLIHAGK